MTSRNLKEYEQFLKEHKFLRVHNSHLVNLADVLKYVKTDGGYVEMKDGSQIPVLQSHKEEFFDEMKKMI